MKRYSAIYPYMILTAALVIRCWGLTSSIMWFDESYTSMLAGLPIPRLIAATASDVHPPTFYLLCWVLVRLFGNTALVLRSQAVVFGMLALWACWRLTGTLGLDRKTRLLSLGLLAFNPIAIYYSQEARHYSLLLWVVIEQADSMYQRKYIRLGVYTAVALWLHNYGLLWSGVIGLVGLIRELRRGSYGIELVGAMAAAGLAYLPWAFVLVGQMGNVAGQFWIVPVNAGQVGQAVIALFVGPNIPDSLIPLTIGCLTAGLLLIVLSNIHNTDLLILAAGPFVLAVVISLIWKPMLLYRGLIPTLAIAAVLAANAIVNAGRMGRVVAAALYVPLAVAVVWQVGANQAGLVKNFPLYVNPPADIPNYHMQTQTMISSRDPAHNYYLDQGCDLEPGTQEPENLQAMGFKSVPISKLPSHFYLTVSLNFQTPRCYEENYKRLTQQAKPVYVESSGPLGVMGVYEVGGRP